MEAVSEGTRGERGGILYEEWKEGALTLSTPSFSSIKELLNAHFSCEKLDNPSSYGTVKVSYRLISEKTQRL